MSEQRNAPTRKAAAEFMRKHEGMPGHRAALPPGSLPGVFDEPQGDENRDPPRPPMIPVEPAQPRDGSEIDETARSAGH